MEILKGIPVSPGFAIAEAFLLDSDESVIPRRFITAEEVDGEIERFHSAVEQAKEEIRELQKRVAAEEVGSETVPIFDAHILIISDQSLHQEVMGRITRNRFTAEYAISRSLRKFEKAFHRMDDSYLAQRITDLHDIERRLLQALLGGRKAELQHLNRKVVLIAHDLTPSQTASIDKDKILGFATDVGGMTGHTAIVARARELPAVVGLGTVSTDVSSGDLVIIDGNRGVVVVSPDENTLQTYRRMIDDFHNFENALFSEKHLPAETTDGTRVKVTANIEFPREIEAVLGFGGEEVGLYRTEFIYAESEGEPDEEQHFQQYKCSLNNIGTRPITIRTLDLGADKFFASMGDKGDTSQMHERNPVLGCRAVRYCLQRPQLFRQQIRAICRASALGQGQVSMMIPMITCVDEVHRVRDMIAEVQEQLAEEGVDFDPDMPIGIMVEVPSVALCIEAFVGIADFFSIGTNDLTQYTLAVDRTNEHVASLYRQGHPAVLQLVKKVIECGLTHEIPVSVCGEMAGDPTYVLFLLGLGLRKFSVSPPLIPEVKKLIRSVTISKASEVAQKTMLLQTTREVEGYLRSITREYLPDWPFS